MENLPTEFYQIWKPQFNQQGAWVLSDHSYMELTKDGQMLLLDARGELVHSFSFEIKGDHQIVLSDGRTFGQILEVTSDFLLLSQIYNENSPEPTVYLKEEFKAKQATENKDSIADISGFVYANRWLGGYHEAGKSLEIELISKPTEFYPLTLVFRISRNGRVQEKTFSGKIVSFQGTYSIEFIMQDMYASKNVDWIPISSISKTSLNIIAGLVDGKTGISLELQP